MSTLLSRITQKVYKELEKLELRDLKNIREPSHPMTGFSEEDLEFGTKEEWDFAFDNFCNASYNKKGQKVDRKYLKREKFKKL